MTNTRHISLDIETLDTGPDAVILSIGATVFTVEKGGHHHTLNEHIHFGVDVDAQLEMGRTISGKTLGWWFLQAASTGKVPMGAATFSPEAAIDNLNNFLTNDGKAPDQVIDGNLWTRGPDFDLTILRSLAKMCGTELKFPFWKSRDQRTFVAPYLDEIQDKLGVNENAHSALSDALYQADAIAYVARTYNIPLV